MADVVFNRFKANIADGTIDWDTTTGIRVLLLSTAVATPDPDLDFVADLVDGSNNIELSTTNYGRQDVASRTVAIDDTNNRSVLDAADNVWTALGPASGGPTVRGALVYLRVGADDSTPADDPLIAYFDLVDTQVNSGNFTVQWAAAGLITLT